MGESTALSVMVKDQGRFEVSDECIDILYAEFERKRIVPQIEFKSSYLDAESKKDFR